MSLKLKYIDLQNFQSHKRSRIPLTDFTIMVGQSRAGKTSVFRAMQFLLYGEWDPTYSNDTTKATAVAVEFENGTRVLRIRKDNQNQAAVIRDGETTKYRSFGSTIPGIQSLINARPIEIGAKTVNLNFSLQDDPVFMVSEARPAKAQWIGRLYGAHLITQMLREMAKDKKNTDSRRKDAEGRLQELEKEFHSYDTVEEQEALLKEATALVSTYEFAQECKIQATMLDATRDSFNRDKWVEAVDTKGLRGNLERLAALLLLKADLDTFIESKKELKSQAKILKIDTVTMKEEVKTLNDLLQVKIDLEHLKVVKEQQEVVRGTTVEELTTTRTSLNKAILSDNKCPVCGGPLTKEHEHILSNIARLVGSKVND